MVQDFLYYVEEHKKGFIIAGVVALLAVIACVVISLTRPFEFKNFRCKTDKTKIYQIIDEKFVEGSYLEYGSDNAFHDLINGVLLTSSDTQTYVLKDNKNVVLYVSFIDKNLISGWGVKDTIKEASVHYSNGGISQTVYKDKFVALRNTYRIDKMYYDIAVGYRGDNKEAAEKIFDELLGFAFYQDGWDKTE